MNRIRTTRARVAARLMAAALGISLLGAAPASAQQVITPTPPTMTIPRPGQELLKGYGRDPLAGAFFSPEVVMRQQQAIGLTAEQRTAIVAAISAAQQRFVEMQWQIEPENTALAELVRAERVDEQAALRQIDRVLDLERQIKRTQIELMVRIKNELTAEQQTQLRRLGGGLGFGMMDHIGWDLGTHYDYTFHEMWDGLNPSGVAFPEVVPSTFPPVPPGE